MGKSHPSAETYSYKCTAGLNKFLVEYLLMQNRHLTGEEKNPKTKEELIGANGGMPLLTNLCLALRSDQANLCAGGDIRGDTMLSGKVKGPELMVFNFRGQLQCRMGGGT